ncbi:MAG TPA: LL-diaminopimelate aminotransferase [Chitinivibrionales bacterium]|nr:LL-diaminopimelate aminotransferase [Chitinivibrionales bacterium]
MITINENYLKLKSSYLFSDVAKRIDAFRKKHPKREILRLGIGDVTRALPKVCIEAFHKATDEMARDATFHGYGDEQGYGFLREKIAKWDFTARGADVSPEEIFISDGAKCDTGNFQELFSNNIKIAIPDPVYPVYVDTNVMAGRTGQFENGRYKGIYYLESVAGNCFVPELPPEHVDLIYLCFPNNPTGAIITKQQLTQWVEWAIVNKAIILYDAAYEAFIRDKTVPHSIYEIPGARKVAVEFRSYSKTAGFTGTRCAYTVVPKECVAYDSSASPQSLHALWNRRHTTKFNGVCYMVQRAAEAIYSKEGQKQVRELNDFYLENARIIVSALSDLGYPCSGGKNAPYIWFDTGTDSWQFFDMLLDKAGVVCTPGAGFGKCGEGFVRLSAFNSRKNVEKAVDRIRAAVGKKK